MQKTGGTSDESGNDYVATKKGDTTFMSISVRLQINIKLMRVTALPCLVSRRWTNISTCLWMRFALRAAYIILVRFAKRLVWTMMNKK
jgi:hypothetical protein